MLQVIKQNTSTISGSATSGSGGKDGDGAKRNDVSRESSNHHRSEEDDLVIATEYLTGPQVVK